MPFAFVLLAALVLHLVALGGTMVEAVERTGGAHRASYDPDVVRSPHVGQQQQYTRHPHIEVRSAELRRYPPCVDGLVLKPGEFCENRPVVAVDSGRRRLTDEPGKTGKWVGSFSRVSRDKDVIRSPHVGNHQYARHSHVEVRSAELRRYPPCVDGVALKPGEFCEIRSVAEEKNESGHNQRRSTDGGITKDDIMVRRYATCSDVGVENLKPGEFCEVSPIHQSVQKEDSHSHRLFINHEMKPISKEERPGARHNGAKLVYRPTSSAPKPTVVVNQYPACSEIGVKNLKPGVYCENYPTEATNQNKRNHVNNERHSTSTQTRRELGLFTIGTLRRTYKMLNHLTSMSLLPHLAHAFGQNSDRIFKTVQAEARKIDPNIKVTKLRDAQDQLRKLGMKYSVHDVLTSEMFKDHIIFQAKAGLSRWPSLLKRNTKGRYEMINEGKKSNRNVAFLDETVHARLPTWEDTRYGEELFQETIVAQGSSNYNERPGDEGKAEEHGIYGRHLMYGPRQLSNALLEEPRGGQLQGLPRAIQFALHSGIATFDGVRWDA